MVCKKLARWFFVSNQSLYWRQLNTKSPFSSSSNRKAKSYSASFGTAGFCDAMAVALRTIPFFSRREARFLSNAARTRSSCVSDPETARGPYCFLLFEDAEDPVSEARSKSSLRGDEVDDPRSDARSNKSRRGEEVTSTSLVDAGGEA